MEFQQAPVGNNTFLQCEQDFWEGAKELNSHSSIAETSPSSFLDEFFDDWASIAEPSDFSHLEVFNDVILPSEELTTDFKSNIITQETVSPPSPFQVPTSPLTIRLKRVKCKRKFDPKLGVEPVITFDAKRKDCESKHTPSPFRVPLHFSDDFCSSRPGITLQPLTLKDAIDRHDADDILANCLSTQGTFPVATSLDKGVSLYDTFLDMSLLQDSLGPAPSEDDDYSSSTPLSSSLGSPTSSSVCSLASDSLDLPTAKPKVRKGRCKMPPDIRYLKKKRQNKEAASRYREKKKREAELIENELNYENLRRQQLEEDYARVKQEFFLLKKLMREVAIAKHLVSPEAFD